MDKQIVEGIELWLAARKLEAIHLGNRDVFETIGILQNDIRSSVKKDEYPWQILMRGFRDSEAKTVKISDVKET